MKPNHFVICGLAGGIVLLLLWCATKSKFEAYPLQESKATYSATNSAGKIGEPSRGLQEVASKTNGPLAGAYEMAAFIEQIYNSVPPTNASTRLQLKGLQVVFFLNDYVMAAKTNKNLVLNQADIINAFTNVTQDTTRIQNRLMTYADFPGTLSDHYQSISDIPGEKENIRAIKTALVENGITIDTESDLLMDCIRYAGFTTEINEFYGPDSETPFPAGLDSLAGASDTVFRHRFETRFGLNPDVVANLMGRLKEVHIQDISDAGFQIPAHIQ